MSHFVTCKDDRQQASPWCPSSLACLLAVRTPLSLPASGTVVSASSAFSDDSLDFSLSLRLRLEG